MIYQYYESKENLYKNVLSYVYNRLEEYENIAINHSGNVNEKISEIVEIYFYFLKDNPTYIRMLMWENLNFAKYFNEMNLSDTKNPIKNELSKIINDGIKHKTVKKEIDSNQIMLTLIACSFNYFSNIYTLSTVMDVNFMDDKHIKTRIKSVIEMILRYILE